MLCGEFLMHFIANSSKKYVAWKSIINLNIWRIEFTFSMWTIFNICTCKFLLPKDFGRIFPGIYICHFAWELIIVVNLHIIEFAFLFSVFNQGIVSNISHIYFWFRGFWERCSQIFCSSSVMGGKPVLTEHMIQHSCPSTMSRQIKKY